MIATLTRLKIEYLPLLLFSLLIVHGCALVHGRPPGNIPAEPGLLLDKISRETDMNGTFIAQATIDITTPDGRYPVRAAVVLRKPDLIRIESLPLIGPPDLFLAANGKTLKVYAVTQRKFYKGRATADNLSRFLPLGLSAGDVVSILTGRIPGISAQGETMKASLDGSIYRIDMLSVYGIVRSLWVDPNTGDLVKAEVYDALQIVVYTVRFQEFIEQEGRRLPRKIEIIPGQGGSISATIRYSEIQFAVDTDLSPFDLPDPPGIEPTALD